MPDDETESKGNNKDSHGKDSVKEPDVENKPTEE